jgi:drug/metabolite transporter, DME family
LSAPEPESRSSDSSFWSFFVLSSVSVRSRAGAGDILLAALLWGTTGTARTFAPAGTSPVAVGAARIILGGALLLALASRSAGLRLLARRGPATWGLLVMGALCVAVYQTAFFAAVASTGVAVGTVVTIGSGPAFAGLLSRLTGQARPSRRWLLATAVAVAGCGLLVSGGRSAGADPAGVALALLSGLGYASYATIASRLIARGEDDRSVMGVLFGGAALLLLPVLVGGRVTWLFTGSGLLVTLYLGAVTTGFGYILYARGLRSTPVTTATTLTLAEPAVAAVLGVFVLGEHLGPVALSGLALLAAGLLLLMLPARR